MQLISLFSLFTVEVLQVWFFSFRISFCFNFYKNAFKYDLSIRFNCSRCSSLDTNGGDKSGTLFIKTVELQLRVLKILCCILNFVPNRPYYAVQNE